MTNQSVPALPPLPSSPQATVFISHSSKDEGIVRWLVEQVQAAGHRAWVAEWEHQPGDHLTDKVLTALATCDAYILLLTEEGYRSVYVHHEVGAAVTSGKPVIALVDHALATEPMGLLNDIEQVRFDPDDLAASAAAIATGLRHLSEKRGVLTPPTPVPTQPAMFSASVQMNAEFAITADQVLVGVCALLLIGGLLYLAAEGGAGR